MKREEYEDWKPELGEMIRVWTNFMPEKEAKKLEFVSMSKDGKTFYCHSEVGNQYLFATPVVCDDLKNN